MTDLSLFPESSLKLKLTALLTGAGGVFLLFLILPFTQMIHVEPTNELFLETTITVPRSNASSALAVHVAVAEVEQKSPDMEESPPVLKIDLMDLALKPVFDMSAMTDVSNDMLEVLQREAADYARILSFDELTHAPNILFLPEIRFPDALLRQDIHEGEVVVTILIDEQGRAECEKIESSSHPLLETLVRNVVRKTRFSVSLVEGRPVKVRGSWPLMLRAPG